MNAGIVGIGSYVPEKTLTNYDLEKMVDTSNDWIVTRTGIEQRRIASDNEYTSDLAAKAASKAIESAGMLPEEIELIILATITPDMFTPSTACIVQKKIGAVNAVAFDMGAACSGFVYGLSIANQFIKTGHYKNVLVIGAEALSKIVDWKDRNTCILFGDGAGAVLLKAVDEPYGILSTYEGSDGSKGDVLTTPALHLEENEVAKRDIANPRTLWMDGTEVFKFAVKIMIKATKKVLSNVNMTVEELDMIVPHQANIRIIDSAAKRLKFDKEKIYTNLQKYGNMSAASIPVALDEVVKQGKLKDDDVIVLVGFGGGLTWGSVVLKWKNWGGKS